MNMNQSDLNKKIESFNIGRNGVLLAIIILIVLILGLCTQIKLVPESKQQKAPAAKPPSYDLNHIQR